MNAGRAHQEQSCPCGRHASYEACCGRWHAGTLQGQAPDAESLMRSRYSAYVLGLHAYLLQTWHPDTRPMQMAHDEPGTRWLGLQVLRHEVLDEHTARVAFVARFRIGGARAQRLTENSRFERVDGRWLYIDAMPSGATPHTT